LLGCLLQFVGAYFTDVLSSWFAWVCVWLHLLYVATLG
jgi:hypothetical protein